MRRREFPFEDDFGREDDEVLLLGILHPQVLAFQSADDGHIEPVHHVLGGGLARLLSDGLKLMVFENTGHCEITDLRLEPDRLGSGTKTYTHTVHKQAQTTNHKGSEYEAWELVHEEFMGEGKTKEEDDGR